MEKWTKIRFGICIVVTLLTFWLIAPTVWSLKHPEGDQKMPSWMPNTAMKLGLDLQGGVHMVMGVDLDKVVRDQLASYGRQVEQQAAKEGVQGLKSSVSADKFQLDLEALNLADREKVAGIVSKNFANVLSFVGDTGNIVVTELARDYEADVRNRALEQSIETIRNRIDEFGVAEPVLTRKGDSQILVQFPGAKEPERLKSLIGQTAQLAFQIVHECRDPSCLAKQQQDLDAKIKAVEAKGGYNRDKFTRLSDYRARLNQDLKDQLPPDTMITFERDRDVNVNGATQLRPFLLSTKNVLSGEYIENSFVQLDRSSKNMMGPEQPVVAFQLNAAGAPMLANLTTEFQGYYMAIVLDGIVKSAPMIQSAITGGSGVITLGRGSMEDMNKEARDLSIVLRAGALPASIEVQEERTIGPSLGKDAITAGKNALGLTCILVFAFMWAYYGWMGLLADIVTFINVGLIVAVLGAVGATLTLPGIAGIVLTISMAVDALIIIYERMREELRAGRNAHQVVNLGFDHAFATILDSNVTTAIGAFVLLQYGTGTIRGFALTLLVGIVANVFMATFFTKSVLDFFMMKRENEEPLHMGLSEEEITEATA